VDFIGQLYLGDRKFFLVDLQNTLNVYDDIMLVWLQNIQFSALKRFVVPTTKYAYSEETRNKFSISKQPEFYTDRKKFVLAMYENKLKVIPIILNGEKL